MEQNDIFKSQIPFGGDSADTLLITCSSYVLRPHFEEFIRDYLKLTTYDSISVPGGVQVLTLANFIPKFEALMRKWIQFLIKEHDLNRVIIIGHENCSWYRDYRFGPIHVNLKERQIKDLKDVSESLYSILNKPVETYFAHSHKNTVSFSRIE